MTGFWDGSGISWTICRQSTPCSRQMTTQTPHHSIFTGWSPTDSIKVLKAERNATKIQYNSDNLSAITRQYFR